MSTALRLARRSVRRHLWRSLLVIALIALPVAGATVADGLVRSVTDRDIDVARDVGNADAIVTLYDRKRFDIATVLPPGARAVPIGATYYPGSIRLAVGDRIVRSRLDIVALGDPLTTHLARLTSGRLPKTPNETLVTEPLAERLDLLDGDGNLRRDAVVRVSDGPSVAVTGLAVKPFCLNCADVLARPDTLLKGVMLDGSPLPVGYLIDLPPGLDAAEVARTWPTGKSKIATRDSYQELTLPGDGLFSATNEPILLFSGLGLVAIVVTAGAAFAVGARRQVRELGLVAVNGGTAKHVRRIVLAQGLVLGVLGAATGLLVGAAVTVLGLPLWERVTNQLIEDLRFGWAELAAAAAVGILASVVAAAVPAFGVARMRPADALAGRFRVAAPTAQLPILGVLLVLAGLGGLIAAGMLARGRLAEHDESLRQYGYAWPADRTLPAYGSLAGAVMAVVGLLLVMPALVTAVGRLGDRLPSAGRLAVRDAVRHRHRTVAAGAAIMITVAGSLVAAFVFAAQAANEPKTLPDDTALAMLDGVAMTHATANGSQQLTHVRANATHAVPGAVTRDVRLVSAYPDEPIVNAIQLYDPTSAPGCRNNVSNLGVGTPELIELSTGRKPDARVRAALADGKIVVFDPCLVNEDGTASLNSNVTMPAYLATPAPGTGDYTWDLPDAFVSPETVAAQGWADYLSSVAVTYPAPADLDAVRTAVEDAGVDLYAGESVGGYATGLTLVMAGLAGLVAFLGAGVTVALSASEGRTDLATLAALGAPPRRRRLLAGAQALVVTGLGTLAGLVLGVCLSFAAVPIAWLPGFPVPWQQLLVTTLAVPLLASAVAVLVTPSRLVP